MAVETEQARRMLAEWGRLPQRIRRLSDERRRAVEMGEGFEALIAEIDREIARCVRLRIALEGLMEEMPDTMRRVIELRYAQGMSYIAIGNRMHYSQSHARKLKSHADQWIAERIQALEPDREHMP